MVCRRRPWVLTVHNVVLETGGRWRVGALGRLERFVIGRADHVIATSSDIERSFAAAARAITTIRPVHDLRRPTRPVTEVRAELAGAGAAVAVCVARLHPQKGLDRLLDAWAGVPDATLVVVGGGPLLDALDHPADRLGIGDRVGSLGARDDAADLLAAADLVVIPSRWESGPLVLLEAMALVEPVVTTRVGFVDEVAGEGSPGSPGARLLDVDVSSEELATALVELLDDEVQRRPSVSGPA